MTLPLKAVAFERYMLADDRPSNPMAFPIRLKFSGNFDEAKFRRAVVKAVRRHPLLGAHIRFHGQGHDHFDWVSAGDDTPYVDFADSSVPLQFPGAEQIDLTRQCGVRLWVRQADGHGELRGQFHHSATDGLGAYRFLEDVLCCYDGECRGEETASSLRKLDPDLLARRTKFGLSWWQTLLRLPAELWGVVVGMLNFFLRKPAPIVNGQRPQVTPEQALLLLTPPAYTFSSEAFSGLRQAAKQDGATLNDIMLRDVFVAIERWNTQHDPATAGKTLRIMIPMSLRGDDDELMPATNIVAMVFLDRRLNWYRSHRWLLKTVCWEMNFLKRFRFGLAFIRSCVLVGQISGGLKVLANPNRCFASGVFSNLGKLFTECTLQDSEGRVIAGDVTLEGIESAPPARPFTAMSLTSLSYAGQLTLCMNYDRHYFTPQTAQALLDCIVDQCLKTAGPPSKTAPAMAVA